MTLYYPNWLDEVVWEDDFGWLRSKEPKRKRQWCMYKVKLQNFPGETDNQYKLNFQTRDVSNSKQEG
jgi:hypothetical protein